MNSSQNAATGKFENEVGLQMNFWAAGVKRCKIRDLAAISLSWASKTARTRDLQSVLSRWVPGPWAPHTGEISSFIPGYHHTWRKHWFIQSGICNLMDFSPIIVFETMWKQTGGLREVSGHHFLRKSVSQSEQRSEIWQKHPSWILSSCSCFSVWHNSIHVWTTNVKPWVPVSSSCVRCLAKVMTWEKNKWQTDKSATCQTIPGVTLDVSPQTDLSYFWPREKPAHTAQKRKTGAKDLRSAVSPETLKQNKTIYKLSQVSCSHWENGEAVLFSCKRHKAAVKKKEGNVGLTLSCGLQTFFQLEFCSEFKEPQSSIRPFVEGVPFRGGAHIILFICCITNEFRETWKCPTHRDFALFLCEQLQRISPYVDTIFYAQKETRDGSTETHFWNGDYAHWACPLSAGMLHFCREQAETGFGQWVKTHP